MEQNQQEQRRVAAKEFLQSLNQLEDMLQQSATEDEETLELPSSNGSDDQVADSLAIDLAAFEDAVADIEQYMKKYEL